MDELREKISKAIEATKGLSYYSDSVVPQLTEEILTLIQSQWTKVEDRLPEEGQVVALMDIKTYVNSGYQELDNQYYSKIGWLSKDLNTYWSVSGERALTINAFTHWMPLPTPPKERE